jgi:hypothetical protein
MMVHLSLPPHRLYQTNESFTQGSAHARGAEVMHGPIMQALVWARAPENIVFGIGALAFATFVANAFARARVSQSVKPPLAAPATNYRRDRSFVEVQAIVSNNNNRDRSATVSQSCSTVAL